MSEIKQRKAGRSSYRRTRIATGEAGEVLLNGWCCVKDSDQNFERKRQLADHDDLRPDYLCGASFEYSKNAPHLESAITLGVFVQMFATANCSGGTPKKVSNNILLDPSRKTIFRSTGEIGVSEQLH